MVPSGSHTHRQPEFDPRIDATSKIVLTLTLIVPVRVCLSKLRPNRDRACAVQEALSEVRVRFSEVLSDAEHIKAEGHRTQMQNLLVEP